MNLTEARIIVYDAVVAAIDDSIGRDTDEAKDIDEAWKLILDHLEGEEGWGRKR